MIREFPRALRDRGISGVVTVLMLLIGADGSVEQTRVVESSGFEEMDQAALNVARVMRFTPAYLGDQTVPVWIQMPIRFQSSGRPPT